MDTYNNYSDKEVIVKDSLIGQGEKFKQRMFLYSLYTYIISIVLSLGIPLLFLDWFYEWKVWPKLEFIELLLKSNISGKWQYISFHYNHHHIHYAIMLVLYFYIVAVILLIVTALKIDKIIIKHKYNNILNAEARYKDEIARRRNK